MAELYEKGIVPQDRLSVESAIASYQAGRVPFVSVLESLGTLFLDRGTFVRLLAGHAQERATLEEASLEAVGGMPALGSNGMGGVPSMAAPAWEDGKAGAASRAMSGAGSMREQE
jgi:hypothetical protein